MALRIVHLNTSKSMGLMGQFGRDPMGTLDQLEGLPADLVVARLGWRKIVFCFHADSVAEVFESRAADFRKSRPVFRSIEALTGRRGLVQLTDQEALPLRRKIAGALSAQSFAAYTPSFEEHFRDFVTQLDAKSSERTVDLPHELQLFILRNALTMIVGEAPLNFARSLLAVFSRLNEACGASIKRQFTPAGMLRNIFSRERARLSRPLREHMEMLLLMADRAPPPTVAATLRAQLSRDDLRETMQTLLFAGFETTSTSLLMTLVQIGQSAELQASLRASIDPFTHLDLQNPQILGRLNIIRQAYDRAIRLYPPTWTLAREAVVPSQIGGERLRRGDQIFFGVRNVERKGGLAEPPKLAFGAGRRICIGKDAAYLESMFIIGRVLQTFAVESPAEFLPQLEAQITAHPRGTVPLKLLRRTEYAQLSHIH